MYKDLEARLAKDLEIDCGCDPIWPPLRQFLTERGYFGSARNDEILGGNEGYRELKAAARSWLRSIKAVAGIRKVDPGALQPTEPRRPVDAARLERARARALSAWFEVTANALPDVQKFRERYLGGTLSPGDARRFLRSWPNRLCPCGKFISAFERGSFAKPYLDDSGQPVEEFRDGKRLVCIDPPGWRLLGTHLDEVLTPGKLTTLGYPADDERHLRHVATTFRDGSVIDRLRKLGHKLEQAYDWDEDEGAWFVLTGNAPFVPAATVLREWKAGNWHTGGKVTLEVQPWVSVETVSRAYREAQRKYFGEHKNYPISEKRSEQFLFTIRRMWFIDEGNALRWDSARTWADLMSEWNEEHPEWSYTSWRTFATDFRRATQAIVRPPLGLPH